MAHPNLTEPNSVGYEAGCVSDCRYQKAKDIENALMEGTELLRSVRLSRAKWKQSMEKLRVVTPITETSPEKISAFEMLQYQNVTMDHLAQVLPHLKVIAQDNNVAMRLKIEGIYAPLLHQQQCDINQVKQDESLVLPADIDYDSMNLSREAIAKLSAVRPQTIAAASRIQGMTPAAVLQLLYHVKRLERPAVTT